MALSAKCNRKPLGRFKAESGLSWGQVTGAAVWGGENGVARGDGKGKDQLGCPRLRVSQRG